MQTAPRAIHVSEAIQDASTSVERDPMTPYLTHSSTLGDTALAAIRALLADPRVALPFFGRAATSEMVDRFLCPAPPTRPCAPDDFLLATGPDAAVLGVACVRARTLAVLVDPAHWGQGIGRDLVSGLCAHLDRIDRGVELAALVYRENTRSRRVIEAAGFSFAGLRDPGLAAYAGRPMLRYVRRPAASSLNPDPQGEMTCPAQP